MTFIYLACPLNVYSVLMLSSGIYDIIRMEFLGSIVLCLWALSISKTIIAVCFVLFLVYWNDLLGSTDTCSILVCFYKIIPSSLLLVLIHPYFLPYLFIYLLSLVCLDTPSRLSSYTHILLLFIVYTSVLFHFFAFIQHTLFLLVDFFLIYISKVGVFVFKDF